MPNQCIVMKCNSNAAKHKGISFFRIPSMYDSTKKVCKDSQLRRENWISVINKDLTESQLKYSRVCSRHFHSGKPAQLLDKTNPDWVPSKNMGIKPSKVNWDEKHYDTESIDKKPQLDEKPRMQESKPRMQESTSCSNCNKLINEGNIEIKQLQLGLRNANETIYLLREELE